MELSAPEVVIAPAATPAASPAAPAEEQQAPAAKAEVEAPAQQKVEGEEQHRSRAYRRLDRWRTRAIEAETRYRLLQEQQTQGKSVDRQQPVVDGSDEPKREQYPDLSYEQFVEKRAEWRADKTARKVLEEDRKKTDSARTQGENERISREWNARVEKARDLYEDFDEVCAESEAVVTPSMSAAILESEEGALIARHLAKNPAEAERISKLSPSKQAAAIVALEEKVKVPVKQPSNAPAPINPVGQKGAEVEKDPTKMSQAEYNAWRRKSLRR